MDSGAAINLIKEKILDERDVRQKQFKKFVMGRDEHVSSETVKFNFFNKEHIFHIIPNDFPLPEDGIIGLKFFSKHDTVPDGIYKIKDGIIKVPIQNHSTKPAEIPKRIKYDEIYTMCSRDVNFPKRDESWQRLQEILKLSKLEHLYQNKRNLLKR